MDQEASFQMGKHSLFTEGVDKGSRGVVPLQSITKKEENRHHDTSYKQDGHKSGNETGERRGGILQCRPDIFVSGLHLIERSRLDRTNRLQRGRNYSLSRLDSIG